MKHYLLALIMGGMIWGLASCANQSTTTADNADPSQRNYSQQQLNNTGRHDAAGQLQAADPSVSVSNGSGR